MPFFNLAYRPLDSDFAWRCIAYAREQFADVAADYLISHRGASPHITVCQFEAPEQQLPQLWDHAKVICAKAQNFHFSRFAFRPGTGIHENFTWAQLDVDARPLFMKQQADIAEMLTKFAIEPLTGTHANYRPHLTYARLKPDFNRSGIKLPAKSEFKGAQEFYFTLGRSDINGVYQKMLYPEVRLA